LNDPTAPSSKSRSDAPVVIAIVGYRNAGDIRTCLAALGRLTEPRIIISICENGGAAAYDALIERLRDVVDFAGETPPVRDPRVSQSRQSQPRQGRLRPGGQPVRLYAATSNLGYAGGINVSVAQLADDQPWSAMWILNPDTEPHPDALGALMARAREGYGIVGSRLVFKASERVQLYGGGRWRWLLARGLNIGMNAPADAVPDIAAIEGQMNYVSGASLFATRDFIDSVGPMDERYFLYCEEVDWCLRRGRHRLGYAHDSIVYHAHGSTIGGAGSTRADWSRLAVYLDERNKLLLTRRFFPGRYPLVLLATLLLTLQYLKLGAGKNFLTALEGWWAGLRGEEGVPAQFAGPGARS
jgi:N-acetylglucosaminyl-diphospho-decaprenol L-rhamnosyltransferase